MTISIVENIPQPRRPRRGPEAGGPHKITLFFNDFHGTGGNSGSLRFNRAKKKKNCPGNLPEKETEIKAPARQLQRKSLTNRWKKEKPSDNQDDDRDDERREFCLGKILLHAITS
jgi:hypothetical protein